MFVRPIVAALVVCATPLVGFAADDDNPYKNVKVGDFATYKMTTKIAGFAVTGTTTQKVTAKTDKEATVETTGSIELNGNKMDIPEQKQTVDLTKPYDPTAVGGGVPAGTDVKVEKGKDGKEKIKVGGKEYDCTWTTYKVKGKANGQEIAAEVKAWMSKEVPMGMVKMEMNADVAGQKMEMTMEVTETGNKKP